MTPENTLLCTLTTLVFFVCLEIATALFYALVKQFKVKVLKSREWKSSKKSTTVESK